MSFISALSLHENVEGFGGNSPEIAVSQVEAFCSIHPDWTIAKVAGEVFDRMGRPASPMHLEQ